MPVLEQTSTGTLLATISLPAVPNHSLPNLGSADEIQLFTTQSLAISFVLALFGVLGTSHYLYEPKLGADAHKSYYAVCPKKVKSPRKLCTIRGSFGWWEDSYSVRRTFVLNKICEAVY